MSGAGLVQTGKVPGFPEEFLHGDAEMFGGLFRREQAFCYQGG